MALSDSIELTLTEERARIYVGKAFRLIRNGRLEAAADQFQVAIGIEPALDFSEIPGFWDIARIGQDCAIDALESAGLARESARLRAIVDRRYRPRLVSVPQRTTQQR